MDRRPEAIDSYNVATPQYTPQLLSLAFSLAVGAVTLLALLAIELPWVWRAIAAAVAAAACVIAPNAWFASRWLRAQWRRARLYPALLEGTRALETELATWQGTLALAREPPPVPVEGVYEAQGRFRIALRGDSAASLQPGDCLLVVDVLERRLVGKARVLDENGHGFEAEVHQQLDALFWGFIHQEIGSYRRRMPDGVAVFREADVLESDRAFARLMQGADR